MVLLFFYEDGKQILTVKHCRYDSVIFTGHLRWQDRLNSLNLPFFLSSAALFTNYTVGICLSSLSLFLLNMPAVATSLSVTQRTILSKSRSSQLSAVTPVNRPFMKQNLFATYIRVLMFGAVGRMVVAASDATELLITSTQSSWA
jgi:hypothetical protein